MSTTQTSDVPATPSRAPGADSQELVIVVRETGITWVAQTAATIRATGCAVGLVSGPAEQGEIAELRGHVDGLAVVDDPADPEQIASAVHQLVGDQTLTAVTSASDGSVEAAARAAELLGVGRVSADGVARCRNKYATRVAMRAAGLPVPRFALIHDPADADAVAATVGLPAIIKPVNGAGSHLVEPVRTTDELAAAYHRLTNRLLDVPQLRGLYTRPLRDPLDDGATLDPTSSFLVESMLRGPEYTLDVVVRDGEVELLPLVDKFLVDDRFFERGFVSPPIELTTERDRLIGAAVADAVRAAGLDNTVGSVEVIDDEVLGPTVIEVNPRPGGQLLGTLYDLRTGVNTAAEVIALARGVPAARAEPRLPIPLATLTLFAERTGRVRAIHGLDEVAELPDVIQVVPSVKPGDLVTAEYEVFAVNLVVAGFADHTDLTEIYDQADRLVRIEVDPL